MLKEKCQQLPTFPLKSSIIDVRELDFRVRNGNGYYLSTMATGILIKIKIKSVISLLGEARRTDNNTKKKENQERRINNMVKPHDLLVLLD